MKTLLLTFAIILGAVSMSQAQYKKDGTPDMRYKVNQEMYPYYRTPSYSTPEYKAPSYNPPSTPSYKSPSYDIPTYPTKKDGTPDMRYKENKELYRNPYSY